MASYKTTIQSWSPKLFMTFDGDAFDPFSRELTGIPAVILDESGFDNHGILHESGSNGKFGHRLGMPSLINLEQFQQYSISFGFYGKQNSPNEWEKALIEIPHSSSFTFPDQGKFSVVWSSNKTEPQEATYRSSVTPGSYDYNTLRRPIISKEGVFSVHHVYNFGAGNYFAIECPGNKNFQVPMPSDYHGVDRLLSLVWETFIDENGDKIGTARFYIDSAMLGSQTFNYYDTWPIMNVPTPIYIGGTNGAYPNHGDRNTSNFQMDQISIFDKSLSGSQIGKLFKKTLQYQDMLKRSKPSNYWPMNDAEDPNTNVLFNAGSGSLTAKGLGGYTSFSRALPGPDQVLGGLSAQFINRGQLLIQGGLGSPVINTSNDYCIEFWFAASANSVSTLFSFTGVEKPYQGLTASMNLSNNEYRAGSIQVQENENDWIEVNGNYNDNSFHHMAVQRVGNFIEVWLDGIMAGRKNIGKNYPGFPGSLSFFGSSPGRLSTDGRISQLAIYPFALQEQQITSRSSYRKTFKVRGTVTLRGIPYKANIRTYSHFSGKLINESFSNASSGTYLVDLVDNRLVDIVVMNTQDPNIRYRVYGPVTPSEYVDDPA